MTTLIEEYAEADDLNRKYELLRAEITRLRGRRDEVEYFDEAAVRNDVRRCNDAVDGHLIVFLANDFGMPKAYRPNAVEKDAQNDIRKELLRNKYDDTNTHLDEIRREILDAHPGVHKAIVVEYDDESIEYYLPEGSNRTTNFITVREMVGLIDYTTNSSQSSSLSCTY